MIQYAGCGTSGPNQAAGSTAIAVSAPTTTASVIFAVRDHPVLMTRSEKGMSIVTISGLRIPPVSAWAANNKRKRGTIFAVSLCDEVMAKRERFFDNETTNIASDAVKLAASATTRNGGYPVSARTATMKTSSTTSQMSLPRVALMYACVARARYHRSSWSAGCTPGGFARIAPDSTSSLSMAASIGPLAGSPATVGLLNHASSAVRNIPTD